ncbi:hypothetical protein [Aquipuribacter hungaricus]|uniref:Uncharacterized protein n=1 Tax=Aquipuribacter hungaricus TaxID=545624 RepID=A0ABV7WKI3_9MICO
MSPDAEPGTTPTSTPASTPPVIPPSSADTAQETTVDLTKTTTGPATTSPADADPYGAPAGPDPYGPAASDPYAPAASDPYGATRSTAATEAPAQAPAPVVVEPRGPALGTLVWGCIALAVAGLLGAWELVAVRVDLALALPVAMVTLGLLLVVGAVVTAVRQRR